jgi:hypothetical protein
VRWTTLTHGLPFGRTAAASPTATPAASAASTPVATPTDTPTAGPAVAALDRLSLRLLEPFGDRLAVRLGWRTDPEGEPVVIQRAIDGGAWDDLVTSDETRTDDTIPLETPVDYRVRLDEGDAWSSIDDALVRRVEASSRTVELTGSWSRAASPSYSGGSALSTDQADATMTWRGTARSLIVVGPVGPTRGRLVIDVDGERAEVVELVSPTFTARTVLFAVHWSDGGEHEVRLEARHRSGRTTVAVDDLVILTGTVSVVRDSAP